MGYATLTDCDNLCSYREDYGITISDAQLTALLVFAYDWVKDSLRPFMTPPDPGGTFSKALTLAEANYALYLGLRSKGTGTGNTSQSEEDARILALDFYNEAWRNVKHAVENSEFESESTRGGPQSNMDNVHREFTRGKYDMNDDLVGDHPGEWDEDKGSLDDW